MQAAQPVSSPCSVSLESAAFLPGTFLPLNPLLPYKRLSVGLARHPQAPHVPKHPQGADECPLLWGNPPRGALVVGQWLRLLFLRPPRPNPREVGALGWSAQAHGDLSSCSAQILRQMPARASDRPHTVL